MIDFTRDNPILIVTVLTSTIVIGFVILWYAGSPAITSTNPPLQSPIPSTPLSNKEVEVLIDIFKDDPVAVDLLTNYHYILNTPDTIDEVMLNNPQLTNESDINDAIYDAYQHSDEWLLFVHYLMHTPPRSRLIEAINNGLLGHYFDPSSTEEVDEVIAPFIEQVPVTIAEQIAVPVEQVTTVPLEQTIVPSNSFTDFITSEFGIKCMIAGSVIVVTAIIIHLLVVYYYKTTYTAIAYKCINWISNL